MVQCFGGDGQAGAAGGYMISVDVLGCVERAQDPHSHSSDDRDAGSQSNPAGLPRKSEVSVGPHHAHARC